MGSRKKTRHRKDGKPWGERGDFKIKFYPLALAEGAFTAARIAEVFHLSLQDARNRLYKLKVQGKVRIRDKSMQERSGFNGMLTLVASWELTAAGIASAKWWAKQ